MRYNLIQQNSNSWRFTPPSGQHFCGLRLGLPKGWCCLLDKTWQMAVDEPPRFFFPLQGGSKIDEKELTLRRLATGGTSHDECVQTGVWDVASMGNPNYNEGRPNNYGHMISLWGESCQLLLPTSVWHSCDQLAFRVPTGQSVISILGELSGKSAHSFSTFLYIHIITFIYI